MCNRSVGVVSFGDILQNKLHMLVQHGSDKTYMNWMLLDTIDVMGVSRANYVYVNDVMYTNFTFDDSSQVRV